MWLKKIDGVEASGRIESIKLLFEETGHVILDIRNFTNSNMCWTFTMKDKDGKWVVYNANALEIWRDTDEEFADYLNCIKKVYGGKR